MATNNVNPEKLKALFINSATLLQRGDAAGAKRGLLKVVKRIPDSVAAWYNLALSHQHLGEHRDAIKTYRKVVGLKPDYADAWINLGMSYQEMGQLDEAEKSANSALKYGSNNPRALNLIGTIEAQRGDYEKARKTLERVLSLAPDFADAQFNLSNLHNEMDSQELALKYLKPLLDSSPDSKQYVQLHAQILLRQRDFNGAANLVRELKEKYPEDYDVKRLDLSCREMIRDWFNTIEIAQELLKDHPNDASLWNSLGNGYFQLDSIEKANQCYKKAIKIEPDHPEYVNNLGLTYSSTGDKENAESSYRKAIHLYSHHGEAYRNLVTMKKFKSMEDPDAIAIKAIWDEEDLDDFNRTKFAFALGKIYDDVGKYEEAFDVYQRGNDLKFLETQMDLHQYFAHFARFSSVFNSQPEHRIDQDASPKPIFILGMPRSGTTLTEQIISRHPLVTGCGELPCIERTISRIEKRSKPERVYPDDFLNLPDDVFSTEVKEYVDWVNRLHDIETPFITDKMPFNFTHIWLIRAMFPAAPIVHCQRHPLDVITSNYFQLYGTDISFVYNLEKLTNYYIRYHRLMQHWQKLFEDNIISMQYEAMVQDAEPETRRLIDAVGLPWNDACLDTKRSATAVRTASIWQVRQGIYTTSKGRWRHYEKQLASVIDALVEEGILASE